MKRFHAHLHVDDLSRSTSWGEFVAPGAPVFGFIFTACDNAVGEACPLWPGKPVSTDWGVAEPAPVEGTRERQRKAFTDVAITPAPAHQAVPAAAPETPRCHVPAARAARHWPPVRSAR